MRWKIVSGLVCAGTLSGAAAAVTPPPVFQPSTTAIDPGFRSALLSDAAMRTGEGAMLEVSSQQMPIDWDAARSDLAEQTGDPMEPVARPVPIRPVNATRDDLDAVSLPILLPDRTAVDFDGATARLFGRQGFYTASIEGDGVVIEVFGTRQRLTEAPDPASERRLAEARDADGFIITPGEGSWDVAFNRYGAAYSVTVECGDPGAARCADPDYARNVARGLLIAGGQPGGN
ncbi:MULTISPECIES: hypothetical protein [Hyphobacterium]|uniref:Uncharacterized protein n=1 Tax=Hyphobacterium vulgare TaxID=1736751 RepID=A0ABV6ZZV6_9PROT